MLKRLFKSVKKNFFQKNPNVLNWATKCILTIDDDLTQRLLIKRTLEKQGCRVLTAATGDEGLALAVAEHPDLIFVDVVMPGLKGKDVCRRLKIEARTQNIPVVFLTANAGSDDIIEHFELGAETHLTKPIRPQEIISQVQSILFE